MTTHVAVRLATHKRAPSVTAWAELVVRVCVFVVGGFRFSFVFRFLRPSRPTDEAQRKLRHRFHRRR